MPAMKGKAEMTATLVRTAGLAVDLSAKEGAKLPVRMKVLNWGENPNARGKRVFVGAPLVRALNAPVYPFRKVPLDFEHNTLKGTPAYEESKEPRAVAGFSAVEVVEGQGVYIVMLSWTPAGLEHAANFADLSAAAVTDAEGNVVAMPSVALCRTGAVEGMDFRDVALSAETATALSALINPETEVNELNWKQMICKALGLDAEKATDEEVGAALSSALAKPDPVALNTAIAAAVETALKPVQERIVALNAAGETFKDELARRDKQAILDGALRDGKVVALNAEAVGKLSVEDLRKAVDATPVTVPLAARTPAALPPDPSKAGPTEEQRAIALNCGVDPEAVWPGKK